MSIDEQKDALVKRANVFWTKFGKYVYIGVGIIAFIAGLVWAGQWYAVGKADEFAKSVHAKFVKENSAMFETITRNKIKIEELDKKYKEQSAQIKIMRIDLGGKVDNTIKSGDTAAIAGMFDNLVDRYDSPASWDK